MTTERQIALDGGITLEGPFLELLWAAYQVHQQATVVPKYETSGAHHDVLVKTPDRCILYETTGQAQMTTGKVDKLSSDALQLAEKLDQAGEPPLKEVLLVSATLRHAWPEEARHVFSTQQRLLESDANISLKSIEDYALLRLLLDSGVLGVRLIDNRVVFAGPEDHAIRYDASRRQFVSGFASLDQARFRQLPHSFFPSHYWEQHYQALYEEFQKRMKDELEGEFPWTYRSQYGLTWRTADDLRELNERWHRSGRRAYIMSSQGTAFVENRKARSGNEYYGVYVFDSGEIVTRVRLAQLKGMAYRLFFQLKTSHEYLKEEKASIYVYSASDTWSPLAWAEAREVSGKGFYAIEPKRGSDILLDLLNAELLGFHFSRNNLITLAAPPVPAIRLTGGDLREPE